VLPLRGFRRHNCCTLTIAEDALGCLQIRRFVVVENAAECLLVSVFRIALRRLLIILVHLAAVELFSFRRRIVVVFNLDMLLCSQICTFEKLIAQHLQLARKCICLALLFIAFR